MPRDLLRKSGIRLAGEHGNRQRFELITLRHGSCSNWLGWKDSNQTPNSLIFNKKNENRKIFTTQITAQRFTALSSTLV
jgi:hypothetical protein